ncbi:MAG: hypothetical protein ACRCXC_06690 [Legionella sp.]
MKKIIDAEEKERCLIVFRQATHDSVARFYDELSTIQIKAHELRETAKTNKDYEDAADKAEELYQTLKNAAKVYFKNKTAESYTTFRTPCDGEIKKARTVLEHHRGWSDVFCNVGAAIAGLGVFYLIVIGINYYLTQGEHLFFHFVETDSAKKLNEFEKAQTALLRV